MQEKNRPKNNNELAELLKENGYDNEVVMFENPSYCSAFVGMSNDNRAIYDYNRMIDSLVEDGLSREEAVDFLDFNMIRSLEYMNNGPIILFHLEE